MAACAPPYSVVQAVSTPDRQMVVVPAMSTRATTAIAKVSFTVLPYGEGDTDVNASDGRCWSVPSPQQAKAQNL